MKIFLSIMMVLIAGVLCGIPDAWAVNAKITPIWAMPYAIILMAGLTAGAWLYVPHS